MSFEGPNRLFLGFGKGSKTFYGFNHVIKQLSFCMFSSILIFDFSVILGVIFYSLGPEWAIFGVGVGFKNCFGVSSYRLITFVV